MVKPPSKHRVFRSRSRTNQHRSRWWLKLNNPPKPSTKSNLPLQVSPFTILCEAMVWDSFPHFCNRFGISLFSRETSTPSAAKCLHISSCPPCKYTLTWQKKITRTLHTQHQGLFVYLKFLLFSFSLQLLNLREYRFNTSLTIFLYNFVQLLFLHSIKPSNPLPPRTNLKILVIQKASDQNLHQYHNPPYTYKQSIKC